MRAGGVVEGDRKKSSLTVEEELLEKLKDTGYAADALHVLRTGRIPGDEPGEDTAPEVRKELEYAGELMVVQFFSLIRSFLRPEKGKTKG